MDNLQINDILTLTPFYETDLPALVEYMNDESIYKNTGSIPFPYTENDAYKWLASYQEKNKKAGKSINWAIRQKRQLVGGVGFLNTYGVNTYKDEIGYWLAKPFRRQGIVSKAVRFVCEFAFENYDLHRIEALVFMYNPASAQLLEKCGFEFEGISKQFALKDDVFLDVKRYALLKKKQVS